MAVNMFLKLAGFKGESQDGVGSLIATGIIVAFALMAAQADAATIPEEIATLQAQVAALQSQVTTQQNQLTVARPVLALAPFVSVDPNPEINVRGPNIVFKGANIHIESGSGATDDHGNRTGLGNLIIGYNERAVLLRDRTVSLVGVSKRDSRMRDGGVKLGPPLADKTPGATSA
jgi:hypothetical protein